jgi:hypothetical protein
MVRRGCDLPVPRAQSASGGTATSTFVAPTFVPAMVTPGATAPGEMRIAAVHASFTGGHRQHDGDITTQQHYRDEEARNRKLHSFLPHTRTHARDTMRRVRSEMASVPDMAQWGAAGGDARRSSPQTQSQTITRAPAASKTIHRCNHCREGTVVVRTGQKKTLALVA